jgi:hypothetical protein
MTKKIFGLIALVLFAAVVSIVSVNVTRNSMTVELTPAEEISRATEDGYNKGFADRLATLAELTKVNGQVTYLQGKLNSSELSNTEKDAIIAELKELNKQKQALIDALGNGGGGQNNNLLSTPLEIYIEHGPEGSSVIGASIVLVRDAGLKEILSLMQEEGDNAVLFLLPQDVNAIRLQVRIDHLHNGNVTHSTIIERTIECEWQQKYEIYTFYDNPRIPLSLTFMHLSLEYFGIDGEFTSLDIGIDCLDFDPNTARVALTSVVFV